ncbi:MAG: diguanylate cyclase (GGDEF)-like protein [Glaciecola sp.]|jgi:diguanylate cyclase (GGDEF)-like protein
MANQYLSDSDINTSFLDEFCSGHLVVNVERKIIFCNTYIGTLSQVSPKELIGSPISDCFTKASNIFLDSYIYPLLLNDSVLEESQMSWSTPNGGVVPVIVNIKLAKDGLFFWSLYICANRDKLNTELIKMKETLEIQTKDLYVLATTDSLTGLLNRRQLLAQANSVAHQMNRSQSTYAVLALDVDFFKQVNDTYGHQAGDNVLVQLANQLTENRRANDLVARVGGEEFIILLPDINEVSAFEVAEGIRLKVAEQVVDTISITISIGVMVSAKNKQVDLGELMILSDNALLESKRTGRNKTTMGKWS